jgi:hypothetical protein
MEPGCKRRDFGRDVQPAVPNRPRCCPWWDPRSERYQTTEANSTQHSRVFLLAVILVYRRAHHGTVHDLPRKHTA